MKIILIVFICALTVSAQVKELLEKSRSMDAQSLNLAKIRTIQNISNPYALQNGQNSSNNNSYSGQPEFNAYSSQNSTTQTPGTPQNESTTPQYTSILQYNVIRVLDLTKANFYKIEPKTQIQKYYNATSGFYEVRLVYNTSSHSPDPFPEGTYFMINDTLVVIDLGYNPNTEDSEIQMKFHRSFTEMSTHTIDIPILTPKFTQVNKTSSEGYLKKINVNGTSELYNIKNIQEDHQKVTQIEGSIFQDPLTVSQEFYQTNNVGQTNGVHINEEGKQKISGGSTNENSNYEISVNHSDLINAERQEADYDKERNYNLKRYQDGYMTNRSSISSSNSYSNETINASALNDRLSFNEFQQSSFKELSNYHDTYSNVQSQYKREASLLDFTHTYLKNQNQTTKYNETSSKNNDYSSTDELDQFRYRNISKSYANQTDHLTIYNQPNNYQLVNNTIYDRNDVNGYSRTQYNDTYTFNDQNYSNSSDSTQYNTSKVGSYMKVPNKGVGRLFHLNE